MAYKLTKEKFLSDSEYEKLMLKLHSLKDQASRDSLIILLALATGARAQELLNLRPCDLDQEEKTVFIRGLKNSNDRDIPLEAQLFLRLETYIAKNAIKSRSPIFAITYKRLYQIWPFWGPKNKTFHSLRHTFAVRLYQRTRDIKLVQAALGHKSFDNTIIYLEFSHTKEQMRRLIVQTDAYTAP